MLLNLSLAVAWLLISLTSARDATNYQHRASGRTVPAKRVAIIGGGAGGSAAAYYLSEFASAAAIATNITVFESVPYIGGRSTTVYAYDAPSIPVELGASIFVSANRILTEAVVRFNLSSHAFRGTVDDDGGRNYMGVWDGHEFVLTSPEDLGWWDKARLLWRYGLAPIRTMRLMKRTVGAFLQMYEEPYFPWTSLSETAHELGLNEPSAATGAEFLRTNGIGDSFAHDVVQASTRVNYAQNLALVNGLISMVCMATDGAMSIDGGNWQIFANMASAATRDIRLNTTVTALVKQDDGSYVVDARDANSNAEHAPERFDAVILAAPYQFSNVSITPQPRHVPDTIPYVQLHVTLFTSPHRLAPSAFNLAPDGRVPDVVLTTLAPTDRPTDGGGSGGDGDGDGPPSSLVGAAGFFSISKLRTVRNPTTGRRERLYKVFSPEPVNDAFLARILLGVHVGKAIDDNDVSWLHRKVWRSYPVEMPRVTFEEVVLDEHLWYTSGIESFISTMETSALAGKNVARLVVDGWIGGNGKEDEAQVNRDEGLKEL